MALVVVKDAGLKHCLDLILVNSGTDWIVFLYSNDFTPDKNTVLADLTPVVIAGLDEQQLSAANWSAAVIDTNQGYSTYSPALDYQATTAVGLPVTAYGWGMYSFSLGKLLMAERFAETLFFTTTLDSLTLFPRLRTDDL